MANLLFNFVRGILIGIAEVIPGVSGGTIALVTGIYQRIIDQADQAVRALFNVTKPKKLALGIKSLDWKLLSPVLIGMFIALIVGARFIEPLLENYPIHLRALFAGLVAAGIYIPYRLVKATSLGDWRIKDLALALFAAAIAFFLTGLPAAEISDPSLIIIFLAAAIAICALVLPGVSGSFLLLSFGLYAPTIAAVNDRNATYLLTFALGAFFGLASFVIFLRWLLKEKPRPTLVVLSGLMLGSLRALWPWQDADRKLLPADEAVFASLALFVLGGLVVWLLIRVEKQLGEQI
jgi:putative membrane protein